MKTRTLAIALAAAALLLAGLTVWQLLGTRPQRYAEIVVDNKVVRTVDLSKDQTFTVTTPEGYNVVEVKDGRIAVLEADCDGNDCVQMGAKNSGAPIICLPHKLVIRFSDHAGLDGLTG